MQKNIVQFIFLLFLNIKIYAGIYMLIEAPDEVGKIITINLKVIEDIVKDKNQGGNNSYIFKPFEPFEYTPYVSLAFLSHDQLPLQDIKNRYPDLENDLRSLAKKHKKIDFTENIKKSVIESWPGKCELEYEGLKKKNYLNVVLKTGYNPDLVQLAHDIRSYLKKKYKIVQRFPFSTHITIGHIFDINDHQSVTSLQNTINFRLTIPDKISHIPLTLKTIKLRGYNNSMPEPVLSK